MQVLFDRIRIAGLDIELTGAAARASGRQRLHSSISGEPPAAWVKIFEEKRRFPRQPIWRNAGVIGAHARQQQRRQFAFNSLEAERLDRLRNPSRYRGK